MKRVKWMNTAIVYPNQWAEFVLYNPYTIEVNHGNRNYYNCGGFEHLARKYRNRKKGGRIMKGKRLEYEENNRQRGMIKEGNR